MSRTTQHPQVHPAAGGAEARAFVSLRDLLAHYRRLAPNRHAILGPGCEPITYADLWRRADDTRRALRSLGIGRTERVAVVLPSGPEAAVAILAVATVAICVPLNPNFTADEWYRYFGDLQVAALLTRADIASASRAAARALEIPIVDLSPGADAFCLLGSSTARGLVAEEPPAGSDDAFILLTSGTASRPKTVPLTHGSVCLSAYNAGATLALGPGDRLLHVLPLFHAHGLISGLLAALAAGSSAVCTPGFAADAFFGWLSEFRPTWYTAVPTIHRALLAAADRHKRRLQRHSLRLIRSASASLPADVLRALETQFGVPVIETYGMTEAASQIAANPLLRRKPGSVGQAAGAEISIQNLQGQRLGVGETGEIALRGPTLTRGYDNDSAATQVAFRAGWFLTGDLGYLDADGYLFLVGRSKDVIKRGGQQVSPAEVEAALLSHPSVVEAVAFSVPHSRLGEDVAAAVVLARGTALDPRNLRSFARERLADYKVPGLIRIVAEIPKSAAGKIKRADLAAALGITPTFALEAGDNRSLAASALERELAEIWAELLQVEQIGREQDVFLLGADSLTVTQVLSRLQQRFAADLSFGDIFAAPTIAELAVRLQTSVGRAPVASLSVHNTPAAAHDIPLSFQQQRLYLLSRLDSARYNYQIVDVARLSGPLDLAHLQTSLAAISERHEALRSTFLERLGEPVQTMAAATPRLACVDLRSCARRRRATVIRQQARRSQWNFLDIANEPLLRLELLRFETEDHALIVTFHHLITDGWSQRLFWAELEALYGAKSSGRAARLPELCLQYRHFVAWQRAWLATPAADKQLRYWRGQLGGMSELPLRTDRRRPERWSGKGARYPVALSTRLSAGIRSLARSKGVTLFMTLLAAFKCLLFRYTEHADVAVGSLIANRNQVPLEHLIGMFANTIILRTDLSGDPRFSEVLARVRQVTLEAYRNQDLPIEKILQSLQAPRSLDRNALFQVMCVLQNALPKAPQLPDLSVHFVDFDPGVARFDLTLELADSDGRLRGWLEYNTDLFEAATIARMATHLRTLLAAIVANPEERVSGLSLLPAAERRQVLTEWNGPEVPWRRSNAFGARFASQVERAPEAAAVSTAGCCLSYGELAARSSAIAGRLVRAGIGRDRVVGVVAERGIDLLAAMLAVQQAGGAFLALDPALPGARLAHVIEASCAAMVLVAQGRLVALEPALADVSPGRRPKVLALEEIGAAVPSRPLGWVRPAAADLAYVVFTSGSTGVPKGAMIERRGLFNHLLSQISDLGLSASDVVAQTAPQSFVISVWQFLAPLMVGARVHVCANEVARDPALLAREIEREGVTIVQIVPALLRAILARAPHETRFRAFGRLRYLISTGEPLPADLCRHWFGLFPHVPLINAYGSAECSDDVATHRLSSAAVGPMVPIGRAIANTHLYVLDRHLQPVPIGVAGELYVGGMAVGRGYLNDPERTQLSFRRDPFAKQGKGRLYRTGDLARWRADGVLECLGRADQQVKIRGHRIEPGEIEHALREHPDVRAAVVLAKEDIGGAGRLLACITAVPGRQPTANALREFLKTTVPSYMIPAGFVLLERMPLTAHGKLDRAALAEMPQPVSVASAEFVAPRSLTEQALAEIWLDVLQLDNIGVFSNFFDLGGHSLLAGQVLARVARRCGVSLPMQALFESPTLAALAQRVDAARNAASQEPQIEIFEIVHRDGPLPVSLLQEQVLRIERALAGLPLFNLPFAYRLQGQLNIQALRQSLTEVGRRHEALRTSFAWRDERPVALAVPGGTLDFGLAVEDLAAGAASGSARGKALLLKQATLMAEQQALTPFDLTRAPLCRAQLLRLGAEDHVLLLLFHHVIVDGWSINLFLHEVSKFYSAFAARKQPPVLQPALGFSDVARWQRRWCASDAATRQLAYWKARLHGASPLFARDDHSGGAALAGGVAHEPLRLETDLVMRLGALGRSQGGTLFMTLLTGFKALLLAQTRRRDICVATAMANRSQQSTEHVMGPLENTTLIRTQLQRNLSFREALQRVRAEVLAAHAHQQLPFAMLAERLAREGGPDPASLTQAFFVMQNTSRRPLKLPDVAVHAFGRVDREGQPVLPVDRTSLTLMLKERPGGITGSCNYKQEVFEAGTIRNWLGQYRAILAKAATNPETSLDRLLSG